MKRWNESSKNSLHAKVKPIEAIIQLQSTLEHQGKKQVDLEDYLDSLLMKVMANAPDLLQKDLSMTPASKLTPSIK